VGFWANVHGLLSLLKVALVEEIKAGASVHLQTVFFLYIDERLVVGSLLSWTVLYFTEPCLEPKELDFKKVSQSFFDSLKHLNAIDRLLLTLFGL
jgi:hypothetical protein